MGEVVPRRLQLKGGLRERVNVWRAGRATTGGIGLFKVVGMMQTVALQGIVFPEYNGWDVSGDI